ncbi:MAG TPA: ABC transporter permease [Burkholderiaceae bacterium]|jgi:ABC-type multidrug transport system permease subunit
MNARIYFNQLRMGLKIFLRAPAAVFWLVGFPIALLLVLGTVLRDKVDDGIKLSWSYSAGGGALNAEDAALKLAMAERGLVIETLEPAAAEARWQLGKTPALLEGQDGKYNLRINTYYAPQGRQIHALVQQSFLIAQTRVLGVGELSQIPVMLTSPGGRRGGPYAAYLLPGLLGLNLLMMGLMSVGMVDAAQRERGGYKRLATTPLPHHVYIAAQISIRLIIAFSATVMLLLAGAAAFGIYNQGSYLSFAALVLLGASCFICLGYALSSFMSGVDTYAGVANLVLLPLMMLSGVYFAIDSAPVWLQRVVEILPLAPLVTALRAVFNDGASLSNIGPSLAIIATWTLAAFAVATKRFRWV